MKTFKEYETTINELFDRPARWKITRERDDELTYRSTIDGKSLLVVFNTFSDDNWETSFVVDGKFKTTGGGDEITVFSTVLDIMADFINRVAPGSISFTAFKDGSSDSRSKLYDRLIKRFASKHGYRMTDKDEVGGRYIDYELTRKR
jgi:hypothetical protein